MRDYIIESINDLSKKQRINVLSLLKACGAKIGEKGDGSNVNLDRLNEDVIEMVYAYVRHCVKKNKNEVAYMLAAFGESSGFKI